MRIVSLDVLIVSATQPLDALLDGSDTAVVSHGGGGEVGVHTGAVPVARDWLGVQAHANTEIFSHSVQEVPGHPEVVTHGDALARTYLELPLCRHNLSVLTRNVDTSVEARPVVGLHHITTVDPTGAHTAVVGALGSWEALLGPAIGVTVDIQQGVLLLHTEPGMLVTGRVASLDALGAVVGVRGLLVVLVGLAQHDLVLAQTEGVPIQSAGVQVNVAVAALCLAGRGTVEVPDWQFCVTLGVEVHGPGLGAEVFAAAVYPDVHDLALLVRDGQPHVPVQHHLICVLSGRHLEKLETSARCSTG